MAPFPPMSLSGLALLALAGLVIGLALTWVALRGAITRRARSRAGTWQAEQVAREAELAVERSRSVLRGQMVEHLVPLFDEFTFEAMADARFLGKPVDFIVFDGYTEVRNGRLDRLREIVFVDVKTGRSRLTPVERAVRACVEEGKVRSVVVHPDRRVDAGGPPS